MNSELVVKDVEFHGDILRAAQDPDGKEAVRRQEQNGA